MKKKIMLILCILLCMFFAFLFKKYNDRKIYESLYVEFVEKDTFEYGSDLDSLDLIVGYEGEIKSIAEVDSMDLSTQNVKVIVFKDKVERSFEKEIKIVDTKFPIIELNKESITVNYGKSYDFNENVKRVYDLIDGELNYEVIQDVDFNTPNTYVVKIKAMDKNGNETIKEYNLKVLNKEIANTMTPTYINGILLVNKTYGLPSTYGNGVDSTAYQALQELQKAALKEGHDLPLISGYRSYSYQKTVFDGWVDTYGLEYAQNVSARPGHSEHQTGLAFDVASLKSSFGETEAGKWLAANCAEYGFILRYPKDKTHITGYYYEPWHIRYVGKEHSIPIMEKGLTLEEYLGVKS